MSLTIFLINIFISNCVSYPNLWPLPQKYTNGSHTATICNSDFKFIPNIQSSILNTAITRFNEYLFNAPHILRTTKISNLISVNNTSLCDGIINVNKKDKALSFNTNESYSLSINASIIIIRAETIYGAMYGLTTLKQLIGYDPTATQSNIISNIPWNIEDYPIYKHRGVMVDSSRNFLSVNMIKKVLDGMALNKLNVFHWHLIDAQSFPFYSKSHPELTKNGAYSQDEIYYPSNITDLILYAVNLGIRIIPEFDTPGHSMVISFGDPNIMECVDMEDNYPSMCPEPPCGYLNVNQPLSYDTILDIYHDAYQLFNDSYFHIGADEVGDECWGSNATKMYIQWIDTMCNDVHSIGNKTPILWSGEINVEADIGQNEFDIIIQVWDSAERKLKALKNGFKIIDSIYTSYYLDCGFGSWLTGGDYSWCDPYKNWVNIYNHSITEDIPNEYLPNIYGAEVCLWGETVDDNNLLSRLWPRAAAGAERWWSNKPLLMDELNDVFNRLAVHRDWMVKNGINASPLHPQFCTLYPDYCDFYRDAILKVVDDSTTTTTTITTSIPDTSNGNNDCNDKRSSDNGFTTIEAIIMFFVGMTSSLVIIGIVYGVCKYKDKRNMSNYHKSLMITDQYQHL